MTSDDPVRLDSGGTPRAEHWSPARGRLIFALDATASREPTWKESCAVQARMFEAAGDKLDVMLIYFRGDDECRASSWLPNAASLEKAMQSIACETGETQIHKVLTRVIAETKFEHVHALVLVGDACEEDKKALRYAANELGYLHTPVFCLQEGKDRDATEVFRQIARFSGGAHLAFSLANVDKLRDLLAAIAVFALGGVAALRELADRNAGAKLIAEQLRLPAA